MEDKSYQLIIEYFEKTISDDGLTQLQDWIEESQENLEQFSETIQILEASKLYFSKTGPAEKSWAKVHAHVVKENKATKIPGYRIQWLAYAAIYLIIGICGIIGYKQLFHKKTVNVDYAEISNPDGQHSKIILPDSSIVHLGGGSKIKYAKNFTGANRNVYLDGEAFFDVIHDSKRPFVVKSGDIATVVLGTSFNVRAFAATHKVAVTVVTGKVGVMATIFGKPQLVKYLLPNEEIEINTRSGLFTFNSADATAVSAWINNNFIFYNTPLREITVSLEHHYGVKIEFTDLDLGRSKLTANFNDIPLQQVIKDLSTLSGLTFTQKGNHIFISNSDQKGGKIMK